jgi:hypothetical protein
VQQDAAIHYSFIYTFIHSFVNGSTALVGPWPLLQFRNPFAQMVGLLSGGSARRKVTTYTQDNTNTE